jgi:hypothetical protein
MIGPSPQDLPTPAFSSGDIPLPVLFAVTIFVSATLLFLVQPMIAKMVLPLLGGTPAVWNTCMVFFQAVLLAGYAYAHATTAWLGVRRQVLLHTALLLLPLLVLPIGISRDWVPPNDSNPIPWLLALLTVSVGLPFFVLSSSAPLLQKWFAGTGHASAKDPYFLYAASNLGSMLALLSYPTLIEPWLPLKAQDYLAQNHLWALGYGLLVVLVVGCGWAVWRRTPKGAHLGLGGSDLSSEAAVWEELRSRPTTWQRLHWIGLAFVPSSLMLGVTSYITLDIAAVPLLWIIPLALYLLSFIIVFARWPLAMHKATILVMPLVVLLLVFTKLAQVKMGITLTILLHLLAFFLVAMVCHGELARRRPPPRYLTEFYLLMSVGGVLGGLFNALVAPLAFTTILEYPIAMVLACLLLPRWNPHEKPLLSRLFPRVFSEPIGIILDLTLPLALALAAFGLVYFFAGPIFENPLLARPQGWALRGIKWLATSKGEYSDDLYVRIRSIIMYGLPVLLCYACVPRPLRFGLCVAALFVVGERWDSFKSIDQGDRILHQERSFFGVLTVRSEPYGDEYEKHTLMHGDIMHGEQILSPDLQDEPITYYHRTGPLGQMFSSFQGPYAKHNVALIGLGSGTTACYSQPGRNLTFYDIDPAVVRIAQNPAYFTYWSDCRPEPGLVLGDARLMLELAKDHSYDVIAVDAFSSDAIPIHLITRQAIELYFRKLSDHGVLAVHVSNRYLDLRPVLGNIAEDLGLFGLFEDDLNDSAPGKSISEWVVLVRQQDDLGWLAKDNRWEPIGSKPSVGIWTDDFSNLLRVFRW